MNEFDRDLVFSQEYHYLLEHLYNDLFHEGRYVFIDRSHFSLLVQTRLKVDVVGQTSRGSAGVEEKVVRWPGYVYTCFFLETDSCTVPGHESQGWMHNGEADYLLYAFETEIKGLDLYLIPFQQLKTWFWLAMERTPNKYRVHTMPGTINHTRGRLVPIIDVLRGVPAIRRYHIAPDGTCKRIATSLTTGRVRNEKPADLLPRKTRDEELEKLLARSDYDLLDCELGMAQAERILQQRDLDDLRDLA